MDVPYRATLKYLVQLVALLAAIVLTSAIPRVLTRIPAIADYVDREFPKFEIRNGVAYALPVAQSDLDGYTPRVLLDLPPETRAETPKGRSGNTDKEIMQPTPSRVPADIVVQRDAFLIKQDTLEQFMLWLHSDRDFEWPKREAETAGTVPTVRIPFAWLGMPDGVFSGEYCRQFLRHYLLVALPVTYLMMVLVGLAVCLLQSQLFAFSGMMLEQHLPVRLSYQQLRNLATYAITPAAIIVTVYLAFNLEGLNLPLIYLIAYGIFLIGSTNACRPRKEPSPVDDSEFY